MNSQYLKLGTYDPPAQSVLECGSPRRLFSRVKAGGVSQSASGLAQSKTWRSLVASMMFLTAAVITHGQIYSVDWHTLGGGGGVSAGGAYAVTGTIGQPDAGAMSAGPYALAGGFWSASAVAPPAPPTLSIERLPGGAMRVFWSRPAEGFVLEEVGTIISSPVTGWSLVPLSLYQTNATHISLTIANPTGARYFRLR